MKNLFSILISLLIMTTVSFAQQSLFGSEQIVSPEIHHDIFIIGGGRADLYKVNNVLHRTVARRHSA